MYPDHFAEKFSKVMFNYLLYSEDMNLVSDTTITETFKNDGETVLGFVYMLEFVTEIAKAVRVLSMLSLPNFQTTLKDEFKSQAITRRSVFTFLATYCFENHADKDDIFAVVLDTLTFVFRTVVFCSQKGSDEFLLFAAMCWTEIFEADLKVDFHASGGWGKFRTYVAERRYALKDGDEDQREIAAFLEEIGCLSPKMDQERPDPQPSGHDSDETIDNLEESLVVESQSNSETSEFSFDTVFSNVPGFKEESEACVEEVDELQTDDEEDAPWYRRVASIVPGFYERIKESLFDLDYVSTKIVELVGKVQT